MKMRFYQFEKLFALLLPKLYDHFKQEKLDASYYITPWMITMFTQVYQFALKSVFLNIIWDIFLVESWKGILRLHPKQNLRILQMRSVYIEVLRTNAHANAIRRDPAFPQ